MKFFNFLTVIALACSSAQRADESNTLEVINWQKSLAPPHLIFERSLPPFSLGKHEATEIIVEYKAPENNFGLKYKQLLTLYLQSEIDICNIQISHNYPHEEISSEFSKVIINQLNTLHESFKYLQSDFKNEKDNLLTSIYLKVGFDKGSIGYASQFIKTLENHLHLPNNLGGFCGVCYNPQ